MTTRGPGGAVGVAEAGPQLARDLLRGCVDGFPSVELTVSGHCMAPALREGERVRLVAPWQRRPRSGDVVLTATPEGLRLHRLLWAPSGGTWRTKADRARTWDPAIAPPAVLATAVEVRGTGAPRTTRNLWRLAVSWAEIAIAHARAALRRLAAR